MADRGYLDLTYGHLGRSIYDPVHKTWRFSREPGRNRVLKPLGPYEIHLSASIIGPDSSHEIDYSLRKLARTHPEVVPAISLLPSLARISEVVTDTTSRHDPTISTRLAIGKARDLENQSSGQRTVPILAIVTGSAGESLRLLRIESRKLGWESLELLNPVCLSVPDITGGEGGWWSGAGGHIKQICFAQNQGQGGSWLAVRQLNSTTILRPLYHRLPVFPPRVSKDAKIHPPSRINANAVVTLPTDRTGGSPHADVAFNPWYNRQFGIVDQRGHWSVWNFEGKKNKRNTYRASLEQSGPINQDSEAGQKERAPTDCWGAICWVGNAYTLATFGRRDFAIFNLRQNPARRLQVPDLGLSNTSRWILDAKASPFSQSHLFVVTTSQIFWLEVTSSKDSSGTKDEQSKCRILLSWGHSRFQEDTSLQINLFANEDSTDTILLLSSRLTGLVTVFQFAMHPQQSTMPVSTSDPYNLEGFPEVAKTPSNLLNYVRSGEIPNISNLLLLPSQYVARATVEPTGLGRLYKDHDVKFYILLILGDDLSLRSRLYTSGVPRDGWDDQEWHKYEPVKLPDVSSRRTRHGQRSTAWVIDDRFVVEDEVGEESDVEEAGPNFRFGTSRSPIVEQNPWTLNWEWLYKLAFLETHGGVTGSFTDAGETPMIGEREHTDCLTDLGKSLIAKRTAGFQPIETMLELHGTSFQASDLVGLSSRLHSLMDSFNTEMNLKENQTADSSASSLVFKSLSWPLFPAASTEQATSTAISSNLLDTIYNHLSRHWLTPIRDRVSEELYATNERAAKQVAISLYLSSIGAQLHTSTEEADEEEQSQDGARTRLPSRLKEKQSKHGPFSSSAGSHSIWGSQTPNPLSESASQPGPSRLSSARPSPSRPSPTTPQASTEDISCVRLRAYATVKPQPPLPTQLSKILTDWTIGADPTHYSWEASQRALNPATTEEDDEQMNDRADRRKRDHDRTQWLPGQSQSGFPPSVHQYPGREKVRNDYEHTSRMAFSSQLVVPSTAPPADAREEDDLPMTQVERGLYGGRQATHHHQETNPKKKRKRREAGF